MDLLHEAVLVGGLDFWRYRDDNQGFVEEPRLRDVIADRFEKQKLGTLSLSRAFRRPPTSEEREHHPGQGIQVLQFPAWFVCQRCRALVPNVDLLDQKKPPYQHSCERGGPGQCVPVRFVLACRHGHIEEFRWVHYTHQGQESPCPYPSLRLEEGPSGDVSEIFVRCLTCDAPPRPLVRAYAPGANGICGGHRPWLGRDADIECNEPLRLLARSASNNYFAQIMSGLSIPDPSRALSDAVAALWESHLQAVEVMAELSTVRKQTGTKLKSFTDEELFATIAATREGKRPAVEPLRSAEWRALNAAPAERSGDMPPPRALFFARKLVSTGGLPPSVERVVLVPQLREVRVQVGFTRLEAPTPSLEGEFDLGVTFSQLGLHTDWLPATEVRGEGIFLALDGGAVARWEQRDAVKRRQADLLKGFEAWRRRQAESLGLRLDQLPPMGFPGARFYLLHSLAHLLINALSLECGYSASSLAERIYCSAPDADGSKMAGILISTGTPGAEGTLGGLVEQGRHLRRHLVRAIDLGRLCSHDPVCAAHTPAGDIAERHLEGAACHGCLFVAECSCERFNQYLDRALVVPTVGHDEDLAFFSAAL